MIPAEARGLLPRVSDILDALEEATERLGLAPAWYGGGPLSVSVQLGSGARVSCQVVTGQDHDDAGNDAERAEDVARLASVLGLAADEELRRYPAGPHQEAYCTRILSGVLDGMTVDVWSRCPDPDREPAPGH